LRVRLSATSGAWLHGGTSTLEAGRRESCLDARDLRVDLADPPQSQVTLPGRYQAGLNFGGATKRGRVPSR